MENEDLQLDYWDEMAATTNFAVIAEIKRLMDLGDIENLKIGINKFHHYLALDEQSAVEDYLSELMYLILKGTYDSRYRIGRWANKIDQLRDSIAYRKEFAACVTDEYIKSIWEKTFNFAKKQAEIFLGKGKVTSPLTWYEVFEKEHLCLWRESKLQNQQITLENGK